MIQRSQVCNKIYLKSQTEYEYIKVCFFFKSFIEFELFNLHDAQTWSVDERAVLTAAVNGANISKIAI